MPPSPFRMKAFSRHEPVVAKIEPPDGRRLDCHRWFVPYRPSSSRNTATLAGNRRTAPSVSEVLCTRKLLSRSIEPKRAFAAATLSSIRIRYFFRLIPVADSVGNRARSGTRSPSQKWVRVDRAAFPPLLLRSKLESGKVQMWGFRIGVAAGADIAHQIAAFQGHPFF